MASQPHQFDVALCFALQAEDRPRGRVVVCEVVVQALRQQLDLAALLPDNAVGNWH
jgi:hypothetical protein